MGLVEALLLAAGSVAALSTAAFAVRRAKKSSAYEEWRSLLHEVARDLGGRVSAPSPNEAPSLRAEVAGRTVTLTLERFAADPARIRAEAQVTLPGGDNLVRLYIGWDVAESPVDFAHVPERPVTVPAGLDGEIHVHAEDPTIAGRFIQACAVDLLDVRRETEARALEVRVRGGYLTLSTDGTRPTAPMLERTLKAAHRLSEEIHAASIASKDNARGFGA